MYCSRTEGLRNGSDSLHPIELVRDVYARFAERVDPTANASVDPSLAEKILVSHLDDPSVDFRQGVTYNDLRPDRVAMQGATAQMALLQFMTAGLDEVECPRRCTVTT
ncbi:MAG: hypothetical protein R2789_09510 [Microthrixaceae bacterium]